MIVQAEWKAARLTWLSELSNNLCGASTAGSGTGMRLDTKVLCHVLKSKLESQEHTAFAIVPISG